MILGIYAAGLLVGGFTHIIDIARGGWLPYRFAPIGINGFWSALSIFDLLAAVLLWWHRKLGLLLTLAIMVLDVAINSYAAYSLGLFPSFAPLQRQTAFLGFVLVSLPFLWPSSVELDGDDRDAEQVNQADI